MDTNGKKVMSNTELVNKILEASDKRLEKIVTLENSFSNKPENKNGGDNMTKQPLEGLHTSYVLETNLSDELEISPYVSVVMSSKDDEYLRVGFSYLNSEFGLELTKGEFVNLCKFFDKVQQELDSIGYLDSE